MSVVSRDQMRRAARSLNQTERPVLLFLREHGESWTGRVDDLVPVIGIPAVRIWRALAQLSERHLVHSTRLPDHQLQLRLSRQGRQRAAQEYDAA